MGGSSNRDRGSRGSCPTMAHYSANTVVSAGILYRRFSRHSVRREVEGREVGDMGGREGGRRWSGKAGDGSGGWWEMVGGRRWGGGEGGGEVVEFGRLAVGGWRSKIGGWRMGDWRAGNCLDRDNSQTALSYQMSPTGQSGNCLDIECIRRQNRDDDYDSQTASSSSRRGSSLGIVVSGIVLRVLFVVLVPDL